MSNVTATFESADQIWREETTVYWFRLDGTDYGTGVEFEDDEFGIAESGPGPEQQVLDADGAPLTEGDYRTIAVRKHAVVTEEIRRKAPAL